MAIMKYVFRWLSFAVMAWVFWLAMKIILISEPSGGMTLLLAFSIALIGVIQWYCVCYLTNRRWHTRNWLEEFTRS